MNNIADVTEDAFLGGRLRLRQLRSGHRAGHDAMLLAACVPARAGERVADLGAGVGCAGLALAARVSGVDLTLVERETALVALATANIALNAIPARAVALDVTGSAAQFAEADLLPDSFDRVLTNPPFTDSARHQRSPDALREAAHVAGDSTLDAFVHAARRILKPGGTLTLIWRADGLADVLAALSRGFGDVAIKPVHPRGGAAAIRILVEATKGARGPLRLLDRLTLDAPQAESVLRDATALTLGD
jgi:tRNA1(Val) A37 N6-methylase TrmN6